MDVSQEHSLHSQEINMDIQDDKLSNSDCFERIDINNCDFVTPIQNYLLKQPSKSV